MKRTSLRQQFFINTLLITFVVMVISVIVVDFVYKKELIKSENEKLKLHIFSLLSVSELEGGELFLPDILLNPDMNRLGSGLWAAVYVEEKRFWNSLSIEGLPDALLHAKSLGKWSASIIKIQNTEYNSLAYTVGWQTKKGLGQFTFVVAEDIKKLNKAVNQFRVWLAGVFLGVTLSLLVSLLAALRYSFRPIAKLEQEISDLNRGDKKHFSDDYPLEIVGVTDRLNTLIKKEREQREKYRSGMADLAHSLKTPLAIINNEINHYDTASDIRDAVERINRNVEYQLRRAVVTGHTLLDKGTKVVDAVNLVVDALHKIYREKQVGFSYEGESDLYFMGDENDLVEVLGNLLDNGFKHTHSKLLLRAWQQDDYFYLQVDDDGPGIDSTCVNKIFSRGERRDESGMGQGIGLAVVADIVQSYHGDIVALKSDFGGACFKAKFKMSKEA